MQGRGLHLWCGAKIGGGGRVWGKMLPNGNDLFWKWKAIYEELMDPFTETVGDKYFYPILETQLNYCKKINTPLGIAILNVQNLPNSINSSMTLDSYFLIRNITNKLRKRLTAEDMIFYNGGRTFLFLFPNTNKVNIQKLLNNMEMDIENMGLRDNPLNVKGGFAEFPTDAKDPIELQECAKKALGIANYFNENRIIGYFTERRKSIRVALQVETRYIAHGSSERLTCSRNISETGIMLSGMPDLPLGEGVKLIFNLPNIIQSQITVLTKTAWNKICPRTEKMDIGLCFININPTTKEQIRRFVSNTLPPFVHL